MNDQALSLIPMLFAAILWLKQIIILMCHKRVVKEPKSVALFFNLAVFAYATAKIYDKSFDWQYIVTLIVCSVIIYWLFNYFFGISYQIYVKNQDLLLSCINKAINEIENTEVVIGEDKKKIKFVFPFSKRRIDVVKHEEEASHKEAYIIQFKRWIGFGFRRDIISSIETHLETMDRDYKAKRLNLTYQALGAVIWIIINIGIVSFVVMEPGEIDAAIQGNAPNELYFPETNQVYANQKEIKELHEELIQYSRGRKSKDLSYEDVVDQTIFTVEYGNNGLLLYVNGRNIIIFMPDSEIGNKSFFHWICWKIHHIYDKSDGTYYRVLMTSRIYDRLEEVARAANVL